MPPSQPALPAGLQAAHLVLLGLTLLPAPTLPSDGFMQDFFARFPNMPFANMHSLEAHSGGLPHRETLLEDVQVKRQVKKKKKLLFKSKVLHHKTPHKKNDKLQIKSRLLPTPTSPKSKKMGKSQKLLIKSRLMPAPSTPIPTILPGRYMFNVPPHQNQPSIHFKRFSIAKPSHLHS